MTIRAAAGMYGLYAIIMIFAHPLYIYPFGDDRFADPAFTAVQHGETNVHLQVSDGAPGAPAILYFMGNGGSLAYFGASLRVHTDADRTVVAMEYPGGGGIPGSPSEALLKAQALDAYDWLSEQHDGQVVVQGYSLGTGLAQYVAANRDVDGVILTAPYARLCSLMTRASWLPACYLPGVQRWDSLALVDNIEAPVLVMHGADDDLIPITEGQRLVRAMQSAGIEVTFASIDNANHHNVTSQREYAAQISDFLSTLAAD